MIIVSGASGFIGRRLASRLVAERTDADVRCLVKAEDDAFGQRGVEVLRSSGIQPVPTELVSGSGLAGLRSPDIVFHLAANSHTWERNHDCNDVGTENLVRALQPLGPRNHIVFKSTVAVMDNRDDLNEPLRSDMPVDRPPLTRYGRSKLRAEEFLKREARECGFRLSIVRCSTVYGRDPRPNSLFDVLKREVMKGSLVSRLDWPGLTGFIHVDDLVNCLLAMAQHPPEPGEARTYVMATESHTLRDVARLVYQTMGLPYRAVSLPKPAWSVLRRSHRLCRMTKDFLPTRLFIQLWRFNLIVNPVLRCDTREIAGWFPDLEPRRMADCLAETVSSEERGQPYPFSEGSAGDSPAPPGDPPGGIAVISVCEKTVPMRSVPLPVPSGESPDGTGESPVLPTLTTYGQGCPRPDTVR